MTLREKYPEERHFCKKQLHVYCLTQASLYQKVTCPVLTTYLILVFFFPEFVFKKQTILSPPSLTKIKPFVFHSPHSKQESYDCT